MCEHLCDKLLQRKSGSVVLTSDPGMLRDGGREGEEEEEEKEGEKKELEHTHLYGQQHKQGKNTLGCILQPLNLK